MRKSQARDLCSALPHLLQHVSYRCLSRLWTSEWDINRFAVTSGRRESPGPLSKALVHFVAPSSSDPTQDMLCCSVGMTITLNARQIVASRSAPGIVH